MRKIKDVLRLKFEAGLSHERIAAAVGLSKGAVSNYVQRATQAGLSAPLSADLDDAALEALLFAHAPARATSYAAPDCALIHQELKRKGVTLQLLWEEYRAAHPEGAYRYSQFCWHYGRFRDSLKRSMRQVHRAGDKLFIDYSGYTLPVIDAASGEIRRAELFIAVLGASSYTFAEATWTQQLPDWIGSHIRAFEFMGCVPALLVPDNLRSAIKKACRFEPEVTSTYADLARHYATTLRQFSQHAHFIPATKPPRRRACCWRKDGSWRGCATASSSLWPSSTPPSARCSLSSTSARSRSSRAAARARLPRSIARR